MRLNEAYPWLCRYGLQALRGRCVSSFPRDVISSRGGSLCTSLLSSFFPGNVHLFNISRIIQCLMVHREGIKDAQGRALVMDARGSKNVE